MVKLKIPTIALAATMALSSCGNSESQRKAELDDAAKTEQLVTPQKEIKEEVAKIVPEEKMNENMENILEGLECLGLYKEEMEVIKPFLRKLDKTPESLRPSNFNKNINVEAENIRLPDGFWVIDKKNMLSLYEKNKEILLPLINLLSPTQKRLALEWVDEYEVLANHKLSSSKISIIESAIAKSVKFRKAISSSDICINGQGSYIIQLHSKNKVSVLEARVYLFQREYKEKNISGILKEIKNKLEE